MLDEELIETCKSIERRALIAFERLGLSTCDAEMRVVEQINNEIGHDGLVWLTMYRSFGLRMIKETLPDYERLNDLEVLYTTQWIL